MAVQNMSSAEVKETIGSIKRMVMIAALVAVLGYSLLVLAGIEQLFTVFGLADGAKMWLKLGAVTHMLIAVCITLVGIIRTLSLMPHRLGARLS